MTETETVPLVVGVEKLVRNNMWHDTPIQVSPGSLDPKRVLKRVGEENR